VVEALENLFIAHPVGLAVIILCVVIAVLEWRAEHAE
jgi:hypothetical protein